MDKKELKNFIDDIKNGYRAKINYKEIVEK